MTSDDYNAERVQQVLHGLVLHLDHLIHGVVFRQGLPPMDALLDWFDNVVLESEDLVREICLERQPVPPTPFEAINDPVSRLTFMAFLVGVHAVHEAHRRTIAEHARAKPADAQYFVPFDGMAWPVGRPDLEATLCKLRGRGGLLGPADAELAQTIVRAYGVLILADRARREQIVDAIQKHSGVSGG